MKVVIISNVNSSHTQKWCLALIEAGVNVALFSIDRCETECAWTDKLDYCYISPYNRGNLFKYLPLYIKLKKTISEFKPDIMHSHYITNYTFLANLTLFPRRIATSWGSDVFHFPKRNIFCRLLIVFNLRMAHKVVSTSVCMANELRKYTAKPVHVIPFGVDFSLFKPAAREEKKEPVVIACFKHLEYVYAPDVLIKAFNLVVQNLPQVNVRLFLAGEGRMKNELKQMVESFGLNDKVEFAGWIRPENVPDKLRRVHICVYLSRRESFGVSLLESMACKVPLVLSPAEGFNEVAGDAAAALFAEFEDPRTAADRIIQLITDPILYVSIAERAYVHASNNYDIRNLIERQIELYKSILG